MQSLLGLASVIEAQGDLHDALRTINELHVKHSWFAPALMEKARLSLAVHGWHEAMETVSQLQQVDTNNVIAYTFHGTIFSCEYVYLSSLSARRCIAVFFHNIDPTLSNIVMVPDCLSCLCFPL